MNAQQLFNKFQTMIMISKRAKYDNCKKTKIKIRQKIKYMY